VKILFLILLMLTLYIQTYLVMQIFNKKLNVTASNKFAFLQSIQKQDLVPRRATKKTNEGESNFALENVHSGAQSVRDRGKSFQGA